MDKGNISRKVSKLLDKGYITRCDQDDTLKRIEMTLLGGEVLKEPTPIFGAINQSMTRNIDKKDLEVCHAVMQHMILNLEANTWN